MRLWKRFLLAYPVMLFAIVITLSLTWDIGMAMCLGAVAAILLFIAGLQRFRDPY